MSRVDVVFCSSLLRGVSTRSAPLRNLIDTAVRGSRRSLKSPGIDLTVLRECPALPTQAPTSKPACATFRAAIDASSQWIFGKAGTRVVKLDRDNVARPRVDPTGRKASGRGAERPVSLALDTSFLPELIATASGRGSLAGAIRACRKGGGLIWRGSRITRICDSHQIFTAISFLSIEDDLY